MEKTRVRVDKLFKKIEYGLDNAENGLEKVLDAFFLVPKLILKGFDKSSHGLLDGIEVFYNRNGKIIRQLTMPWGYVFPKGYKYKMLKQVNKIPLLRPGMQMVRSKVGGGKSLTSWILAQIVLERTGHPSYLTSNIEKPKLSEDGTYWYVMHPVINLDDYFHSGKQHKRFNTKKYKNMHKDENHLRFNPRMNKTKEYNDKYIPEHRHELVMRHDGFDTITKYSQHFRLDGQDMETLDLMHEVETIKDIPVKRWIEDGKYNYIPVKLKFESYSLIIEFDGSIRRQLYKKWELKVKYEDLLEYDTYAERHMMAGLPFDFK